MRMSIKNNRRKMMDFELKLTLWLLGMMAVAIAVLFWLPPYEEKQSCITLNDNTVKCGTPVKQQTNYIPIVTPIYMRKQKLMGISQMVRQQALIL